MKHVFSCLALCIGFARILQAQSPPHYLLNQPNQYELDPTILTNQTLPLYSADQFQAINQKGEVVKSPYQLRINNIHEWSAGVFAGSYRLRPLASVANYIRQHGHLPDVPSANEVVKDGIDLVKMNALLLTKIEELTVYGIELNKFGRAKQSLLNKQQARLDELEKLVKHLRKKR